MENNEVILPQCRQCPSGQFDLSYVAQSRYMAVCHARECVLEPYFSDAKDKFLSKATVHLAVFTPLDNCPHLESLRAEGKIPFAPSIDFSK